MSKFVKKRSKFVQILLLKGQRSSKFWFSSSKLVKILILKGKICENSGFKVNICHIFRLRQKIFKICQEKVKICPNFAFFIVKVCQVGQNSGIEVNIC